MTKQLVLDGILAAISDLLPFDGPSPTNWQVSVISFDTLVLWDARVNADVELAASLAREFGVVEAMVADPIAGVLVKVPDVEIAATNLITKYNLATRL